MLNNCLSAGRGLSHPFIFSRQAVYNRKRKFGLGNIRRAGFAARELRLRPLPANARRRRRSQSASNLRAHPPRKAHASAGYCRRRKTAPRRPARSSNRRRAKRERWRVAPSDAPRNRLTPTQSGRRDLPTKGSKRESWLKAESRMRLHATLFSAHP